MSQTPTHNRPRSEYVAMLKPFMDNIMKLPIEVAKAQIIAEMPTWDARTQDVFVGMLFRTIWKRVIAVTLLGGFIGAVTSQNNSQKISAQDVVDSGSASSLLGYMDPANGSNQQVQNQMTAMTIIYVSGARELYVTAKSIRKNCAAQRSVLPDIQYDMHNAPTAPMTVIRSQPAPYPVVSIIKPNKPKQPQRRFTVPGLFTFVVFVLVGGIFAAGIFIAYTYSANNSSNDYYYNQQIAAALNTGNTTNSSYGQTEPQVIVYAPTAAPAAFSNAPYAVAFLTAVYSQDFDRAEQYLAPEFRIYGRTQVESEITQLVAVGVIPAMSNLNCMDLTTTEVFCTFLFTDLNYGTQVATSVYYTMNHGFIYQFLPIQ